MKKFFILLLMSSISFSNKAQTILPVEDYATYINSEDGLPSNITKIKDINNVLSKFIGKWEGSYNNRGFNIQIYKMTLYDVTGIEKDVLKMKYKITDQSNNVIYNTFQLASNNGYIPEGHYYFLDSDRYSFIYQGENFDCGQSGEIFIELINNNQLKLILSPSREVIYDCPNGQAEQLFPTENWMILNRTAI